MKIITLYFCMILFLTVTTKAQFNIEGDFRVRWYTDKFHEALDNRGDETYMRYYGSLKGNVKASKNISFTTELLTIIQNQNNTVRNIVGTGPMSYTISQIYAELAQPNFSIFDMARIRVGRQPFGMGSGLSFGESYYFRDKFDGARIDLAYSPVTLTLFGAITGQNLSESGLYPEPGSDQIYAARLAGNVMDQNVMTYYILQRLRGSFNDNQIFGLGVTGDFLNARLDYFAEFAAQSFNTAPGLPEKGGIGYMGGVGYRWSWGPFSSVKVEARYAAYQGDDASTKKIEQFSPPYASFFWGDRNGYVNGEIGGDFPWRGRDLEGSRILYGRIYVIPRIFPDLRIQLQYLKMNEYIDNDNYNSKDDEISLRLYYKLFNQSQLSLRYTHSFPNDEDKDVNNSGLLSSSEDRVAYSRIMLELRVVF